MNTKRPPDHDDEPLLPELEPPPDALIGGSELLDDDEAGAVAAATYLERSIFTPPDTSFFNLPVFYHFRQRPYHRVDVQGPFDTRRLAHDYRQHLYRSEVVCLQPYQPAIESLLLCLGQGVFVLCEGGNLTVFAPTPQSAARVAADFRRYVKPLKKAKPGFYLVSLRPDGPQT